MEWRNLQTDTQKINKVEGKQVFIFEGDSIRIVGKGTSVPVPLACKENELETAKQRMVAIAEVNNRVPELGLVVKHPHHEELGLIVFEQGAVPLCLNTEVILKDEKSEFGRDSIGEVFSRIRQSVAYGVEAIKIDFVEKMLEMMEAHEMSAAELAKKSDVPVGVIGGLLDDTTEVTLELMVKIAKSSGFTVKMETVKELNMEREEVEEIPKQSTLTWIAPVETSNDLLQDVEEGTTCYVEKSTYEELRGAYGKAVADLAKKLDVDLFTHWVRNCGEWIVIGYNPSDYPTLCKIAAKAIRHADLNQREKSYMCHGEPHSYTPRISEEEIESILHSIFIGDE